MMGLLSYYWIILLNDGAIIVLLSCCKMGLLSYYWNIYLAVRWGYYRIIGIFILLNDGAIIVLLEYLSCCKMGQLSYYWNDYLASYHWNGCEGS